MVTDRYLASGSQAAWQPGSGEKLLLNKLGTTDPAAMNEVELHLLLRLYELVLGKQFPARQLHVSDLKVWHRVELILIHPFRECNGRLSRLLADVMAVQAGAEPLDYTVWDANKRAFSSAIQHGMDRDYAPMRELVSRALDAARASGRAKDG